MFIIKILGVLFLTAVLGIAVYYANDMVLAIAGQSMAEFYRSAPGALLICAYAFSFLTWLTGIAVIVRQ